jgi:hypothetical protein
MDGIETALADLHLDPKQKFQDVANYYGIDRSILSKHYIGITHSKQDSYDKQRFLNKVQSKALLAYISKLIAVGLPG